MVHQRASLLRVSGPVVLSCLSVACLVLGGCSQGDPDATSANPDATSLPAAEIGAVTAAVGDERVAEQSTPQSSPLASAVEPADKSKTSTVIASVAAVTVDDTPRPPATVAEAVKWLDLRTFPLIEGATISGDRRQIGELRYDAPGPLQAAFDFQRKALEELGWQLLPDGRLDGENPMADFTQHGFLVSVSANPYAQTPGKEVMITLKNHGNVLAGTLPIPDGVEPFYSTRGNASYVTTNDTDETSDAVWKLILDLGWTPYGGGQSFRLFKQNAILLNVNISTHEAQPGKTFISYSTEQLSADLPVPADVADPRYTDSMKRMHFDHEGVAPDTIAEFYNTELGKLGWTPTSEPVGDKTVSVVYRNDAKDMIMLDMTVYNTMTRVDVEHFTAVEIAAMEAKLGEAAVLAQQEAAEEAAAKEARMATARIELPIPDKAKNVEQQDKQKVTFGVASGSGKDLLTAYAKHFTDAGWQTESSTVTDNFGMVELKKGESSLSMDFIDTGLGGDVQIEISSFDTRLVLTRDAEGFAEVGGLSAPPPIPQDVLAQAPADIAIPADARELKVRPDANVAYDVAASVDRVAASFREAMESHGWTHDDTDIDEDSALVSFRNGQAPCSASMHQFDGSALTSVTIAGGGMNWDKLRAADQPLDPAVGIDPVAQRPVEVADSDVPDTSFGGIDLPAGVADQLRSLLAEDADAVEDADTDGDADADTDAVESSDDGRMLAEQVAVPEAATDIQHDADTQTVIYRSDMTATKIAEFFRKAMTKAGWSEIEDETFVDDELGFGGVGFEKGDLYVNLSIQNGKPDSTSRVLVMGDGIQWPGDEGLFGDGSEEMDEETVAAEFVGAGKCEGKIYYGDETFEMKHVLVALRIEFDEPVTKLFICGQPFTKGALATIAREDASVFDLTGDDYPHSLELTVGESHTSVFAFVDGASISFGGDKVKSKVKTTDEHVAGRVHMDDPHDVFDTPFRFDVTVDVELTAGDAIADEPLPGGLAVDDRRTMLVPRGTSEMSMGGSPYMETLHALIDADQSDVLTFYRTELEKQGWQEDADAASEAETSASLSYTGDEGRLTLKLGRRRGETMIDMTVRQEALAREHGVVAEEGKAMLMLGNATEAAVEITIDGKSHPLAAEQGGRDPADAVKVSVEAGKHTVKVPGSDAEEIDVPAGATWGVIVIPGGGVFSDQVY